MLAVTNYGIYEIDEYAWYDILKIWKPTRIKEVTLIENTEYCGSNCYAIKEITNLKPAPLIEDVRFFRDFGNEEWVAWNGFINWRILVEEDVEQFETICKDGKEIINEQNGTSYFEQNCSQVSTGFVKQWLPLDYKKDYLGTYKVKLEGGKKESTRLDWQVKINGIWTEDWAIWGNISLGDEAEVTLNSPADDSIAYTNQVTFNASANVTGGAYLTNISLWDNSTGSWVLNQTENASDQTQNLSDTLTDTGTGSEVASIITNVSIKDNRVYLSDFLLRKQSSGDVTVNIIKDGNTVETNSHSYGSASTFNFTFPSSEYTSFFDIGDTLTIEITVTSGNNDIVRQGLLSKDGTLVEITNQYVPTDTIGDDTWNLVFKTLSEEVNSSTRTFNQTLYSPTLWNCQACDSDGDCGFASENRTLSLDTTSPSITIEYPTSIINYGENEKTETLNVTFTDGNLDSCWYNYNGTNISIEGCQSGVKNSTTFTLNEGNYNITLYSNDSIGNLNTTFFEWEYSIFGNDIEYDAQVYETAIATFTLNITYNTSQDIDAVINYDEENYTTQNIGTESEGIFQNNLSIPTIAESSNKTFFWYLLINDSIVATTEEINQTINQIILTHCNDTYTNQSLNFTVFDEINATEINTTSNPLTFQATFNYWVGDGDVKKNYSYSQVSGTNNSFQFCIYPYNASNYDFKTDMDAKFSATDFYENNYYLRNSTLTNISSNITLYLLLEDEATKFYITVQEGVSALTDAIITVAKYFVGEGSYKTIGIKETDNQGKFTIYLDEDEEYQYSVVKEGILYAILEETASCSATPCEITLQVDGEQGDIWEGYNSYFANNTLSNLSFNPDTKIVTYTFVDITGLANYFRLEVRQSNMNTTTGRIICDSPSYSSSGRLTCNVTGYDGNFFARGYISRSPEKLDQVISFVINTIQENLGIMGALFSLGVIITVVFAFGTVSRGNPSAILMGLGLSLLILKLMTFLPLGWITLSVIELAILYLSKLTKS